MPNKLFDESRVWILDGAMGTMLQQAGLAPGEIPDVWSVTHPEVVTGIHKAYLEAGCAVEIKIGQGAKPGIGGHLPGAKSWATSAAPV